jgi:hypothetical protein
MDPGGRSVPDGRPDAVKRVVAGEGRCARDRAPSLEDSYSSESFDVVIGEGRGVQGQVASAAGEHSIEVEQGVADRRPGCCFGGVQSLGQRAEGIGRQLQGFLRTRAVMGVFLLV